MVLHEVEVFGSAAEGAGGCFHLGEDLELFLSPGETVATADGVGFAVLEETGEADLPTGFFEVYVDAGSGDFGGDLRNLVVEVEFLVHPYDA